MGLFCYVLEGLINNYLILGRNNKEQKDSKKDFLELTGVVEELLPAATFKVKLESGNVILAHLSDRMRMNRIRVLSGDKVEVEVPGCDQTKGRIVYRRG